MPSEIICGTLYAVNDTDRIIDAQVEKIGKRDGVTLSQQRAHVLLQQTDLSPHGNVSCGYNSAFRCCADAFPLSAEDKPVALNAWRDGWAAMLRDGKVTPGMGARFADCVDYARRAWNAAFTDRKVASYRGKCPRFDQDDATHQAFYRALYSGWMVQIGRYASADLLGDLLDDGIIQDDAKPAGNGVYGHSCCYATNRDMLDYVLDGYPKTMGKRNAYQLDDFAQKVQNGQVMPSWYIFLPA
jgi:hypothetical protein